MILNPKNRDELRRALAEVSARGTKIARVDLSALNALLEHKPEDMTATVEAGMVLGEFQRRLRAFGQWLPIDPPHADRLSLGHLLAHNLSGPRRFGCGPIRDYLIGIKVAMADGEIIKAGGKVVKNVAGYDLCKLFVGAKHSLGIIVEATFKLRPLPEAEAIFQTRCDSFARLGQIARALLEMPGQLTILDARGEAGALWLIAGVAGAREDVERQAEYIHQTQTGDWQNGASAEEDEFWREGENIQKISVLPSETAATLERLKPASFAARYGNGIIYHKAPARREPQPPPNAALHERIKHAYDPRRILPEYTP